MLKPLKCNLLKKVRLTNWTDFIISWHIFDLFYFVPIIHNSQHEVSLCPPQCHAQPEPNFLLRPGVVLTTGDELGKNLKHSFLFSEFSLFFLGLISTFTKLSAEILRWISDDCICQSVGICEHRYSLFAAAPAILALGRLVSYTAGILHLCPLEAILLKTRSCILVQNHLGIQWTLTMDRSVASLCGYLDKLE